MINRRRKIKMETVYIAGGCLWGVQHFFDTVPGVQMTEAGRANGTTSSLDRTGLYSTNPGHLEEARAFINGREDRDKIMLEVLPLTNYVRSAEEHQHHLERHPEDCSYCHIPDAVLNRYRNQ